MCVCVCVRSRNFNGMLKKGPLKHLDEGICECRSPRVISKEREKKKKKRNSNLPVDVPGTCCPAAEYSHYRIPARGLKCR